MFTFVIQEVIALSILKYTQNFVKKRRLVNDYSYDMKWKEGRTDHKCSRFISFGLKIKHFFILLDYQFILFIVKRKNL